MVLRTPDADTDGNVDSPDINIIERVVDLIVALRAFKAVATEMNEAKGISTCLLSNIKFF